MPSVLCETAELVRERLSIEVVYSRVGVPADAPLIALVLRERTVGKLDVDPCFCAVCIDCRTEFGLKSGAFSAVGVLIGEPSTKVYDTGGTRGVADLQKTEQSVSDHTFPADDDIPMLTGSRTAFAEELLLQNSL
jgi:hypothetical protein